MKYIGFAIVAFVLYNFFNILRRSVQGAKYWKESEHKLATLLEKGYDKRESLLEISRARHPELSEITHRTIVDKHPELNRLAPFIHDVLDFRPSYRPVYGGKLTDEWALALLEHTTVSDNGRVNTNFTAAREDVEHEVTMKSTGM
ncbi:MAG TPA: hypothetical protein VMW72_01240 [Sedimentisphaerales bacterium]|nr:hypothetical protein [Sedimentisphaerales bacterium]